MKKYDVIIIGFGPTGGTLANLLALHGFSILIIEKEKNPKIKGIAHFYQGEAASMINDIQHASTSFIDAIDFFKSIVILS